MAGMTITLCRTDFMLKMQLIHLAILCVLFGMVEWPPVKWPPTRGSKGHFKSPGIPNCCITSRKNPWMPFTSIPYSSSIINLDSLMIFPMKKLLLQNFQEKRVWRSSPLNPVSVKHGVSLEQKPPVTTPSPLNHGAPKRKSVHVVTV